MRDGRREKQKRMALTDLNVALRLSTREFNRELGKAENALRQSADRLAGIGNVLTLGITAPLAAIAGGAIVAAGEFEKLRLGLEATMTDAGYSIAQAREELEQLREVAKAPGIDFEQAVKGSLRLQSVGLSAEQARETIAQFANGVAAAGGTADNLNSVTTQLSQIIGKGKILNEDLVILKENMPSVSRALTNAFGTATAEGLRALNVSAEDLVVTLTKELAKAPRVAGGIANSIQNAQVAVREAAAKIGDSLNRAFNITGALDRFAAFVLRVADGFADLSPETQRAAFAIGAFALALGPAIRLGGLLVTAFGNIQLAMVSFVRFANSQLSASIFGATNGVKGLIATFRALDLATKATVIGAAIGVFLALGAAVAVYASASDEAAIAQRALSTAQKTAAESAAQEAAKAEELVRVFSKENASREEKRAAIEALKAINPSYFGQLDAEKASTEEVTKALKAYTSELIRAATVKAAVDRIAEIKTALADLNDEAELSILQKGVVGIIGGVTNLNNAFKAAASLGASNAATAKKGYEAEIGALEKLIDENQTVNDILKDRPKNVTTETKITADAKDAFEELDKITDRLLELNEYEARIKLAYEVPQLPQIEGANLGNTEFGVALAGVESIDGAKAKVEELGQGIRNLANFSREAAAPIAESFVLQSQAAELYRQKIEEIAQATGLLIQQTSEGWTAVIDAQNIATGGINAFASAFAGAIESGAAGWEAFKGAAVNAIAAVIDQLVKAFVAQQIVNASKNPAIAALGPAGIAIAAGAGTIASAVFKRVVGAAKFADGGIVYGPTLGLVGEYPGASNNPEVIAPLSKLRSLINPADEMTLQTRVSGNDLVVLVERAQKQRNRTR